MSKQLLVPLDGSEQSIEALQFAADEWPDAELTLLHVVNPADATAGAEGGFPNAVEQWYSGARERAENVLEKGAESVDRDVETKIEVGRPAHTIVDVAANEDFDQIVVGSHGRSGFQRMVLGSVAEGVMRKAEMPVTVVR